MRDCDAGSPASLPKSAEPVLLSHRALPETSAEDVGPENLAPESNQVAVGDQTPVIVPSGSGMDQHRLSPVDTEKDDFEQEKDPRIDVESSVEENESLMNEIADILNKDLTVKSSDNE